MYAYPGVRRAALRLAAAGWAALSLSACAPSPIDAGRSSFTAPPATAARAASAAQLSLVHHQAHYELNLRAGKAPRPAASHGALHEAYQRWMKGEVRKLPDSFSQTSQ